MLLPGEIGLFLGPCNSGSLKFWTIRLHEAVDTYQKTCLAGLNFSSTLQTCFQKHLFKLILKSTSKFQNVLKL